MHSQMQRTELLLHSPTLVFQHTWVIAEEQKIVQVTNVTFDSQFMLDELIQRIQIDIGQKLAGQISNRQTAFVNLHIEKIATNRPDVSHAVMVRVQSSRHIPCAAAVRKTTFFAACRTAHGVCLLLFERYCV